MTPGLTSTSSSILATHCTLRRGARALAAPPEQVETRTARGRRAFMAPEINSRVQAPIATTAWLIKHVRVGGAGAHPGDASAASAAPGSLPFGASACVSMHTQGMLLWHPWLSAGGDSWSTSCLTAPRPPPQRAAHGLPLADSPKPIWLWGVDLVITLERALASLFGCMSHVTLFASARDGTIPAVRHTWVSSFLIAPLRPPGSRHCRRTWP